MVSDIENIINNPQMLLKAFNEMQTSIDILKQLELKLEPSNYKGEIYSKEEGERIIKSYSIVHNNPKFSQIIHRVKS